MSPLPFSYVPLDATSSPEAEEVSVSTVAATAVATGHLMLKLEGYSRLKARHGENGSYIESSASKVGGHTWTIRCYLNGSKKEDAGFVSLFLYLCSDPDAVVLAECEFALVRHQGTPPAYAHQGKPSTASHGLRSDTGVYGARAVPAAGVCRGSSAWRSWSSPCSSGTTASPSGARSPSSGSGP
jgi:hypothetical protein